MIKPTAICIGLLLAWNCILTSHVISQRNVIRGLLDLTGDHISYARKRFEAQSNINEKSLTILRQITIRQIGHDPIEWPHK